MQGVERKLILAQYVPLAAGTREQRENALIRRMMRVDNWLVSTDAQLFRMEQALAPIATERGVPFDVPRSGGSASR